MGSYVHQYWCGRKGSGPVATYSRTFIREYGEPAKLCQDEPATTSSARSISTSDVDKPPQKCGKGIAVWRLASSSPETNNSLLQKPQASSWSMPLLSPQGKNDRHGTPHHFFHRSALVPHDNITSTLYNKALVLLYNTIMLTSSVISSPTLRR